MKSRKTKERLPVENRSQFREFMSTSTVDRPAIAAALMVSSLFLLGLQDSLVKLVNADTSLWQLMLFRALFNFALFVLLARLIWGGARPKAVRPGAVALRTAFHVAAMSFFFGGIPFLSLAELAAGLYVFPLFVAVLSALVLKERVGPRRLAAIAAGFCGTVLILKPATEAFTPIGLMPVCAGFCYACAVLTTRKLCRQESPVTLAFAISAGFFIIGCIGIVANGLLPSGELADSWPYLFTGWHPATWGLVGIFALISCINVIAMVNLGKAYQSAESSWLAPFDYSYLIFATFWGFVFWQHVPDVLTFVGMAMIALAGSFVAWRERREKLRLTAMQSGNAG